MFPSQSYMKFASWFNLKQASSFVARSTKASIDFYKKNVQHANGRLQLAHFDTKQEGSEISLQRLFKNSTTSSFAVPWPCRQRS